jgi:hypothetical protein
MSHVVIQLGDILLGPTLESLAVGQNSKMCIVHSRRNGGQSLSAHLLLLLFIEPLHLLLRWRPFRWRMRRGFSLRLGFGKTSQGECRSTIDISAEIWYEEGVLDVGEGREGRNLRVWLRLV